MKIPTVFSSFQKHALKIGFAVALFWSVPAAAQQTKNDPVYEAVEQPAQPTGGLNGFKEYISQNLTYPTASLQQKTQGTVEVTFIVEKNGTLTNINIEKGLDEACNNEGLRVLRNSPKWQPAKHDGKIVSQKITMPLIFKIPDSTTTITTSAAAPNVSAGNIAGYNDKLVLKTITPEKAARPINGNDEFFKYIRDNQQYSAKARRNQVQGKVMVEFMVEKDGSLTNLKVLKRLGNGLDEEAVRLIEKGPKWLPAEYNGEPIRQKMILPVVFQL